MSLKFYGYKNCGTCKKAQRFLDEKGVDYRLLAIREQPPTKSELKRMLGYMDGNLRKLFNTSGGDYKALGLKDRIDAMTEAEAFALLSTTGNLVKRPFILGKSVGTVGFNEGVWTELFLDRA